jgi:hypothetical protein
VSKKRPNPAFKKLPNPFYPTPPKDIVDMAERVGADMMLNESLQGTTPTERMLLSAIIPELLRTMRKAKGTANASPQIPETSPEVTKK